MLRGVVRVFRAKQCIGLENAAMTRRVVKSIDRNNSLFFEALPPMAKERVIQNSAQPTLEEKSNGI
jgi:hypothetical protein